MSQHDFNIANQTAAPARADINSALTALASLSSGATAPSTTFANMLWYDTSNDVLKIRNEADSGWVEVGYVNQSSSKFEIPDDTHLVSSVGTQTGLLGDQATATWEAGTGTTESLVSPAKVKAAIEEFSEPAIGVGQTWQNVSRSAGTSYQNTTGRPIMVAYMNANIVSYEPQVSTDNSSWVAVGSGDNAGGGQVPQQFIVPDQHYYRIDNAGAGVKIWSELR